MLLKKSNKFSQIFMRYIPPTKLAKYLAEPTEPKFSWTNPALIKKLNVFVRYLQKKSQISMKYMPPKPSEEHVEPKLIEQI